MSIQWTFIAGCLYFEVAVVIIMLLPILSPRRWSQFFHSRLFAAWHQNAAIYFYVFLGVLALFLMDAVREMSKYSHSADGGHVHLGSEMKGSVKLFRAQRNFYITGFTIFLAFVIRRLVKMLIHQDELTIKAKELIKEAEHTVRHAKNTILASTMQVEEIKGIDEMRSRLEVAEELLKQSQLRVKEVEDEASKWRVKYEELSVQTTGEGDNYQMSLSGRSQKRVFLWM